MKKLIEELNRQGIKCSYKNTTCVEPAGFIVGMILMAIFVAFTYAVFSAVGYTHGLLLYLLPFGVGLHLAIGGATTFIRRRRETR